MLISKYGNGTIEQVKLFEEEYELELDSEYCKFLVKYNGGDTPDTKIRKGKFSSDVRVFYGINAKENLKKGDLEYWIEKKIIPIAEDSFGNLFCIDISNKERGVIYFCDHEKGYKQEKIADSFKKFITMCKSELIDERTKRTVDEREKNMIAKGRGHAITDSLRETWRKEYEKYVGMIQEEVNL